MSLILDAGAFLAFERGDQRVTTRIKRALGSDDPPRTHGGVVGQVWRSGGRLAQTARLLRSTDIVALDANLGRRAGELLGRTGTSDVIDAAVVLLARDGDEILTSDAGDLRPLAEGSGLHVEITPV